MSVFAGLGKTTVGNKYSNVCDLQSSPYRYDYTNIDINDYEKMKNNDSLIVNKKWPSNYIKAIKEAQKKYDIILVPSNLDIRKILVENNMDFIFILPNMDMREILKKRYEDRNNNENMINEVMNYFDTWSRDQNNYKYKIEILSKNKYLEDFLLEKGYLENK